MHAIQPLQLDNFDDNRDLAHRYIQRFFDHGDINSEHAVDCVFCAFPKNAAIEHILAKIGVLDSLYSTNVYYFNRVAKRISELNIDDAIAVSDENIIDSLANITITMNNGTEKHKKLYSFASKYCHFHRPEVYHLYDGNVQRVLNEYPPAGWKSYFFGDGSKKYSDFVVCLRQFACSYGLQQLSVRDLDKFLWGYGQDLLNNDAENRSSKKMNQ